MKFYIVIPAHNEADCIGLTLNSLVNQSLLPSKIVVVDDNSSDETSEIVKSFALKYDFLAFIKTTSSDLHLPGAKIINAFNKGLQNLDDNYDVICKFDADLIFPENYLEQLSFHFNSNKKLGMAAGFCYIEKDGNWILENLTNKDHIRGALKAYRKECFKEIGQLKSSIGWDTIDELLAKYYKWELKTDETLHVKHLKPTGASYNKKSKYLQGEAFYKMRYGFLITLITALKMSYKKKKLVILFDYSIGYFKAMFGSTKPLITKDQGKFVRKLRWKGMFNKFSY
ncbi:glycosyltransferase family 2 protein [Winogradskyella litorisediminis]|uniref:Glycosyltransferase family 2 protein n=1 Tax=Winogradskyella litorisediminis TaxID=1156618 RepID=A0ABW3NA02_9FLAO